MEAFAAFRNALRSSFCAFDKNHPPRQGYMVPVLAGLVMYGGVATLAAATFITLTA